MREVEDLVEVLVDGQIDRLRALDGGAAAPHVHDHEDQEAHDHGDVAAVEELRKAREEEHELDGTEEDRERHGKRGLVANLG